MEASPLTEFDFKPWIRIVLVILGLAVPGAVSAGSLRCDNRIVSVGQSADDVRGLCGEPQRIDTWEEGVNAYISKFYDYEHDRYQAPRGEKGPIRYEAWTYDFGPQRFIRTLIFEDGRLIKIETGDKGTSPPR
jgi:hypothetical protein